MTYCYQSIYQRCQKILENNISLGYVQCNFIEIDSMDKIISNNFNDYKTAVLKKTEALDWQFKYLDCKPAAIMLNLDVINEIKERWTENFWDDWAFYLRIAYKKGMIIIPDILCCIRKHDEQLNVKLINSKDNIQDYYLDQLINVIGVMQPFGLNSSKIFKKQIRDISLSYFFYSIKFFLRFKFRLFYRKLLKLQNNFKSIHTMRLESISKSNI